MCMNKAKAKRVSEIFIQRIGRGWDIEEGGNGMPIARQGALRIVIDIHWAPYLRVSTGGGEDLIELPNIEAEKLGKLMASIATAIANSRRD